LLPILKSAGVVDSGGQGLFILLEGILRHIKGLSLDTPQTSVQPLSMMHLEDTLEEIEEGQDYEVVIDFKPFAPLDLENYYDHLKEIGTSIQVGEGDGIYRMHIHVPTDRRYDPIDYTLTLGAVTKVNIENLTAQIENNQKDKQTSKINLTPVKPGQIAVVVVSPGLGISHIFASLGANAIVEGGQTMNPSTEEILKAFENLPTDHIIILPNNKNIVLAAQSAASMTVKKVTVIASTSVPQGLSAMLRLVPDGNYDQVVKEMMVALTEVETGEITTASRTVEINGIKVNQGEVIALYNGNLIDSEQSLESACLGLLEKADAAAHERITLFYGSNITKNEVNQVVDKIRSTYPSHEIELHEGGQPHYQLILSIE
jgi:hypothetical protein